MGNVVIVACPSYDHAEEAVRTAVKKLGGMERFIQPGEKVCVKPNLVMKRRPEEATTTHPSVTGAVAKLAAECGAQVVIGDTPGGLCSKGLLSALYETCGMAQAARESGAALGLDPSFSQQKFPLGKVCKSFDLVNFVGQADKVISVGKVKTHMMSYMTGCVKNLFGAIPGTYKAEYHFRMPDKKIFCDMLVDLCECIHPVLSVADAVVGMEGDGPTSGTPKQVGYIVAGENPYEVDYVLAQLIALDPALIYTLENARERGLFSPENITLDGTFTPVADFQKPSARDIHFAFGNPFRKVLDALINPWPQADGERCVGCGRCAQVCPAQVIKLQKGRPVIDYKNCIRCFCCHELCPVKAMELKRSLLWRWILTFSGKQERET